MKSLLQSGAGLLLLAGLFILGIINTVQLNNLEAGMIENKLAIAELRENGVAVSALADSSGSVDATTSTGQAELSDEDQALIDDPANLLKPVKRSNYKAAVVKKGGTFRRMTGSDPPSLNPYGSNAADVTELSRYVMATLGERHIENPSLFAPSLGLSVTTPDDGLTYVVKLRKGVKWHKPNVDWQSGRYEWLKGSREVVADDFKFVFDMIQNPQVGGRIAPLRNYFESFERIEIVDEHTFKVVYNERLYSNLPMLLGMVPMPRWLYMYDEDGRKFDDANWGLKFNEHWYNQKMIGMGPYQFALWEPGVKIELKRNPTYFGERPSFDRVVMNIIKDQNAFPRKLKTGEADMTRLQPEQYRTEIQDAKGPLLGNPGIKFKEQSTLGYFYLGWNADTVYFSDKRVRQAMTLAFNREGIIKNVFVGLGKLTTGPFAQQNPCYDDTIEPWPFDLDLAAKKLAEAGWKDTDGDGILDKTVDGQKVPFEFSMLIYGSSSEFSTLANIYREDLLQIGIKLTPRAVEWSTMLKKMNDREFDVYTGAWVLGWETDLVQLWHSKEADKTKSSNRIGFRNKEADRIADTLRRTFDEGERLKLCRDFHKLVHDEQPYTFIYQRNRPVVDWDYLNDPEFSIVSPYRNLNYFSFNQDRP